MFCFIPGFGIPPSLDCLLARSLAASVFLGWCFCAPGLAFDRGTVGTGMTAGTGGRTESSPRAWTTITRQSWPTSGQLRTCDVAEREGLGRQGGVPCLYLSACAQETGPLWRLLTAGRDEKQPPSTTAATKLLWCLFVGCGVGGCVSVGSGAGQSELPRSGRGLPFSWQVSVRLVAPCHRVVSRSWW